jgi:hypothetical protein
MEGVIQKNESLDVRVTERLTGFRQSFERSLAQNDIIAIGEHHGNHFDLYKIMMEYLDQFDGIFWEERNNYQSSIDDYIKTGEFDDLMKEHFEGARKEGSEVEENSRLILDSARAVGIPVICVDSSGVKTERYNKRSKTGYYFLAGESRDEDMYNNVLDYYKAHPGKYLLINGGAHLFNGPYFRDGTDTLGKRLKSNSDIKTYTYLLVHEQNFEYDGGEGEKSEVAGGYDEII